MYRTGVEELIESGAYKNVGETKKKGFYKEKDRLKGIVLLGYKAESGKDESAKYIKEDLESQGYSVCIMHNAYYLKDIAKRFLNWDGNKDEDGRKLLQELGTDEIRDRLGWSEFHCNRVCEDIKIVQDYYDYVLVPDARFINEIYYVKAMFPHKKVISVHVDRGDHLMGNKGRVKHKSEIEMEGFDFDWVLHNKRGLTDLRNVCSFFVEEILLEKDL